jgi:hypothetical protein
VRPNRVALAVILAFVGLVWTGQGVGLIGGSMMTGSGFWAVVGTILLLSALAIVVVEYRASRAR